MRFSLIPSQLYSVSQRKKKIQINQTGIQKNNNNNTRPQKPLSFLL